MNFIICGHGRRISDLTDEKCIFMSDPIIFSVWKADKLYDRLKNNYRKVASTVQSRFSDILFSDKSRFSDNFAEDHFSST